MAKHGAKGRRARLIAPAALLIACALGWDAIRPVLADGSEPGLRALQRGGGRRRDGDEPERNRRTEEIRDAQRARARQRAGGLRGGGAERIRRRRDFAHGRRRRDRGGASTAAWLR